MNKFVETQRAARGHNFYPPKNVSGAIPTLYANESLDMDEVMILLHYFAGSSDWWISEVDHETGEAYGYVCLGGDSRSAEWGYISLPELENLRLTSPFLRLVERDLHWQPKPFRRIKRI